MTEPKTPVYSEGFKHVYTPTSVFGELELAARERPATFWVTARGGIGPKLLRSDLAYAQAFGRGHPEGWDYVVDLRSVRWVHPWNPVILAGLRELPHLRHWIVISDSGFLNWLLSLGPHRLRPDRVVADPDSALELASQDCVEPRASGRQGAKKSSCSQPS